MTDLAHALEILSIAGEARSYDGTGYGFSAGTFWRPTFCGRGMSGLTPAPTRRVHAPSGVATHGVPWWSAGQSRFRSARVVIALLVPRLA
jgi:hypothetical protein